MCTNSSVADLPVDSDEIRELQKEQQLQKEIQLVKEENDANAVRVEADEMTGFGQANPPPMNQLVHSSAIARDASGKIAAHVKILEQPAENKLRFR